MEGLKLLHEDTGVSRSYSVVLSRLFCIPEKVGEVSGDNLIWYVSGDNLIWYSILGLCLKFLSRFGSVAQFRSSAKLIWRALLVLART